MFFFFYSFFDSRRRDFGLFPGWFSFQSLTQKIGKSVDSLLPVGALASVFLADYPQYSFVVDSCLEFYQDSFALNVG